MKSRLYAHIGTFRQLELLLAVFEHGSIKGAAENLHLAQPTVSMQLKKLAEAIGLPLYEQVGKKLYFTEAGLKVVQTSREILENIERLDMELSDLKGIKSGSLKLAVVTSSKYFAPHLMGAFSQQYPGVDVQLKVGNRQQIIERLEDLKDDFYIFSHLPEDVETINVKFLRNPMVAIAHKDHPLAKKRKVKLEEFCKEPFISRETGSGTRYAIDKLMEKQNLSLQTSMTIESNEAIKHAVISGLGVSILSAHSLSFTAGSSDIKKLNVEHLPIYTDWYFAWSPKKQLSAVANAFLEFLDQQGKDKIKKVLAQHNNFM